MSKTRDAHTIEQPLKFYTYSYKRLITKMKNPIGIRMTELQNNQLVKIKECYGFHAHEFRKKILA